MASEKQISANRRNAQKSTGPKTEVGKLRSRQNSYRHGLTAQTVISLVENGDEYADLEALIIADYEPQTTIERVLVERLASLLWRLRRAVAIETGLFQTRDQLNGDSGIQTISETDPLRTFRKFLNPKKYLKPRLEYRAPETEEARGKGPDAETVLTRELGRRFLKLTHIDGKVLERIERYEIKLWRQVAHTMLILNSLQAELKYYGRTNFRKYPGSWSQKT